MIDVYCERLGPGLWAEPLNVTTNLAFFLAAGVAWRLARRRCTLSSGVYLMIILVAAIGAGSGLFHAFAASWARVLDRAPILLFGLVYLWIYCREVAGTSLAKTAALLALCLATTGFASAFSQALNGSLDYAPALLYLLGLGLYHSRRRKVERFLLLGAAGLFGVSLFFRTIDQSICPYFSSGSHFLWHLLSGLMLYLAMRALIVNLRNSGVRSTLSHGDSTPNRGSFDGMAF